MKVQESDLMSLCVCTMRRLSLCHADFWREHKLINMSVGKIVLTCLLGKSRSMHLLWGCQVETRSRSGKKTIHVPE